MRNRLFAMATVAALLCATALMNARVDAHTRITTDVTWSKDIRAILAEKCMPCHRPGGIAPDYVDLTVYGTDTKPGARAWAVAIEEEILTGQMPPWQPDPRFEHFSNALSLTQEETDMIVAWVRGGAPQGPQRNLPPPPEVMERDWIFGEPDVVIGRKEPFVVPANEAYAVHTILAPVDIEEDTYITGIEFLPGDPKNIKSITAWIHDPEGLEPPPIEVEVQVAYDPLLDEDELEQTRMRPMPSGPHFLGTWFRGTAPVLLPDEAGRLLRAGSDIELLIEYERPEFADWSQAITDETKLGLFLATEDEEIDRLIESTLIAKDDFVIPANEKGVVQRAAHTFDETVHLVAIAPRLNRLGESLQARLRYPDGLERVVLNIPEFDWRWNQSYRFAETIEAPAGSTLMLTATYDNTEDNWDNPNSPPEDVRAGEGQFDEQFLAVVDYMVDDHLYVEPVFVPEPEDDRPRGGMSVAVVSDLNIPGTDDTEKPEAAEPEPELLNDLIIPEEEIYWCPMRGDPCALKDYHGPGTCDECWMDLRPKSSFFEDQPIAPETNDWALRAEGIPEVYWCPNRGLENHELKDYASPGTCEVCGETLMHSARFEFVPEYTCLTPTCERFKDIFYGPGLCPVCGQPVAGMGHMDHNPVHGGWQFFMADNLYHHLEGTMPEPGLFKLYLYDDWKKPLDARNFKGTLVLLERDAATGEVTESETPLYVGQDGDEFLLADVPEEFPVAFYIKIWLAGEEKRFDFEFEELTTPPAPDATTGDIRLHTHERQPLNIPDDTEDIVAMLRARSATLSALIDAEDWFALHNPAFDAKDLAEALSKRDHPGMNVRARGDLKTAVGLINRGANGLDRAGDAADPPRVRKAYETFTEGMELIDEIFPVK